jgi:hypothetical protein
MFSNKRKALFFRLCFIYRKYRIIEYRPLEIAVNDATRRRARPGGGGGRGVQAAGPRLPPHPLLPAAAAHTLPSTQPNAQLQDPDQGLCFIKEIVSRAGLGF